MAMLVAVTSGYAQKKAVSAAKNKAMNSEQPDFAGAREAIRPALENDETKDQANTWYVAGLIGYKEAERIVNMSYMGTPIDEAKKGAAVMESYAYWKKALELTFVPTYDKKGREVYDTKTRAEIVKKLHEYYKDLHFVKYGIYLNDNKDYATAYDAFEIHLGIPDLEVMQDPKLQKDMVKNADYKQYQFYAGLFATQSEKHEEAIKLFESIKEDTVEAISVSQFLYQEYVAVKDTVKFVETLKYAIARFPQEPWFLQNLINHYIYTNQKEEAANYLQQAIEKEPTVIQYYTILGRLYNDDKRFAEAADIFQKAIALDANNAEAQAGMGYVYMDQAGQQYDAIDARLSNAAYEAKMKEVNDTYRMALPYFEKAHQLDAENIYYMRNLKQLYYRFISEPGMKAKYDAVSAEMGY